MCDHARSNVLFCLLMLHTKICQALGILIPALCCVFYATRHHIYWRFERADMVFDSTLTLYHTQKNTQVTQGSLEWHRYIHMYSHHLLHVQNSYLYYTELITWSRVYFKKVHSALAFQNLLSHRSRIYGGLIEQG